MVVPPRRTISKRPFTMSRTSSGVSKRLRMTSGLFMGPRGGAPGDRLRGSCHGGAPRRFLFRLAVSGLGLRLPQEADAADLLLDRARQLLVLVLHVGTYGGNGLLHRAQEVFLADGAGFGIVAQREQPRLHAGSGDVGAGEPVG